MKKLIIFCDGTWNSADQHSKDNRPCPTNVARLFKATAHFDYQNNPQIAHYIRGVGTRFGERIWGGGFGYGISSNIREGYQFICSNYEQGDQIYLFGFSRGAFTARSIAGLIRNLGILRRDRFYLVNSAYDYYRDKSPEWAPDSANALEFQKQHCWPQKDIHFIGVWDTVGALGLPFGIVSAKLIDLLFKCRFHDTKLSSCVKSAYHALAKDEHRWPFRPTHWEFNDTHKSNPQLFQEKWFSGAHSDVGGGYPETGLSDVTLKWMTDNAQNRGLKIDLARITEPAFKPDPNQTPQSSQNIFYRLATLAFVKWPAFFGIAVPGPSKKLIRFIDVKGDYHRPLD